MKLNEALNLANLRAYGTQEGAEKRGVGRGSRGGQDQITEDPEKGSFTHTESQYGRRTDHHTFKSPSGATVVIHDGVLRSSSVQYIPAGKLKGTTQRFSSGRQAANYAASKYGIQKTGSYWPSSGSPGYQPQGEQGGHWKKP